MPTPAMDFIALDNNNNATETITSCPPPEKDIPDMSFIARATEPIVTTKEAVAAIIDCHSNSAILASEIDATYRTPARVASSPISPFNLSLIAIKPTSIDITTLIAAVAAINLGQGILATFSSVLPICIIVSVNVCIVNMLTIAVNIPVLLPLIIRIALARESIIKLTPEIPVINDSGFISAICLTDPTNCFIEAVIVTIWIMDPTLNFMLFIT